uniref:Proteasome subunit alpha type n=1 Tax=Equus asinus TaxID=9793 RepID=A0A8C4KUL2_EQUAS
MYRGKYDNDLTVWSPLGKIHQIEYAMEAVKQGSATAGLKLKTHTGSAPRCQSLKKKKKIPHADNHSGISVGGLAADARLLCNSLHLQCLDSRFVFDRPLPVSFLVSLTGSKIQIPSLNWNARRAKQF